MRLLILVTVIAIALSACETSSHITSSWKAENAQPVPYKKVVVMGLIRDTDRSLREKMEQHIVDDLRSMGYNAVCSCQEYDPRSFEGLTEEQAIAKLKNAGVDAVVTVVLLDKRKERNFVQGRTSNSPSDGYGSQFWEYYVSTREKIFREGYYVVNTKYFWETGFYDLARDQHLYSARSQSFDPSSAENLAHEYGAMIVKDMKKKNIVAAETASGVKGF